MTKLTAPFSVRHTLSNLVLITALQDKYYSPILNGRSLKLTEFRNFPSITCIWLQIQTLDHYSVLLLAHSHLHFCSLLLLGLHMHPPPPEVLIKISWINKWVIQLRYVLSYKGYIFISRLQGRKISFFIHGR